MDWIEQARKYYHLIRWDAASFLTRHDGHNSRLFHDKFHPTLLNDLGGWLRGVAGGIVRFVQASINSLFRFRTVRKTNQGKYILLITVGTTKYAGEEQEYTSVCRRRGLGVQVVYPDSRYSAASDRKPLSVDNALKAWDYLWSMAHWMMAVLSSSRFLFSRDRKMRSLFVAVIPSIRRYYLYTSLAQRIIKDHGMPCHALSLCPSSALSVGIVSVLKERGIPTAGIRTQTTSLELEHLAINTDILFCKSRFEKRNYQVLFGKSGPLLVEGCLLSLPEAVAQEPLRLPDEYALLLGTGIATAQSTEHYKTFNQKLFMFSGATGLPIVFKGHNLAKEWDDEWFSKEGSVYAGCHKVEDISRNRELIDSAALLVSAPSTLLYYAILRMKPIVLVEPEYITTLPDEFNSAPIQRFKWGQNDLPKRIQWETLKESSLEARSWFDENYFLPKGADYIVDFLLERSSNNRLDGAATRRTVLSSPAILLEKQDVNSSSSCSEIKHEE